MNELDNMVISVWDEFCSVIVLMEISLAFWLITTGIIAQEILNRNCLFFAGVRNRDGNNPHIQAVENVENVDNIFFREL